MGMTALRLLIGMLMPTTYPATIKPAVTWHRLAGDLALTMLRRALCPSSPS